MVKEDCQAFEQRAAMQSGYQAGMRIRVRAPEGREVHQTAPHGMAAGVGPCALYGSGTGTSSVLSATPFLKV